MNLKIQLNGFIKKKRLLTLTNLNSLIVQKINPTSKLKQVLIGDNVVKVTSSVTFLGIHKDDQLNFNLHINDIFKSASKQFNVL